MGLLIAFIVLFVWGVLANKDFSSLSEIFWQVVAILFLVIELSHIIQQYRGMGVGVFRQLLDFQLRWRPLVILAFS